MGLLITSHKIFGLDKITTSGQIEKFISHVHLCVRFLIMRTRIIIHYYNGMTRTGDWNDYEDFKLLCIEPVSSLEIQEENGNKHTLSLKRKHLNAFWQRDKIECDKILTRSILKRLSKDVWIDLTLDCTTGNRTIIIIREDIKVK